MGVAIRRRNAEIAQLDVESPSFFSHRVGGIGAEVHEDLLHLGRVCEDQIRLAQGLDADI